MPSGNAEEDNGSAVYLDFVKELVEVEDMRGSTLESRGSTVITSSGALVTLLLGLATLVTKLEAFTLGAGVRTLLVASVAAFAAAVVLAIGISAPQRVRIVDGRSLRSELQDVWHADANFARMKTTSTRLDQLAASQGANDAKARLLLIAVTSEVIGVVLVAVGVVVLLVGVTPAETSAPFGPGPVPLLSIT